MTRRTLLLSVALSVATAFALYANMRIINKEAERLAGPGRTEETLYEARLKPLKEMLPADAVVGYVTDEATETLHKTKYFHLAQYDLCPILVVKGVDHPFVIGGYYDLGRPPGPETAGLILVKDFGYGIRLYRGRGK
ncbi:MAG: hypothetical protein ABSC19_06120 [Syntrophorhabdales bacterium]|jgi:hypothetical protein